MENTHDPNRPFGCSVCQKRFNSKETHDQHVSVVHELKNCEICPHCEKPFSRLKVHLKSCSVKFGGNRWSNPSSRPSFECPNCDKIYFDKQGFNKHIKKCSKIKTHNPDQKDKEVPQ